MFDWSWWSQNSSLQSSVVRFKRKSFAATSDAPSKAGCALFSLLGKWWRKTIRAPVESHLRSCFDWQSSQVSCIKEPRSLAKNQKIKAATRRFVNFVIQFHPLVHYINTNTHAPRMRCCYSISFPTASTLFSFYFRTRSIYFKTHTREISLRI